MKVALTGRWRKYEAKKSSSQAARAGVWPSTGRDGRTCRRRLDLGVQGERDPAALVHRALDGVDDLLHPRTVLEGPLILLAPVHDLVDEVPDQVCVEQGPPGLPRMPADGVEA